MKLNTVVMLGCVAAATKSIVDAVSLQQSGASLGLVPEHGNLRGSIVPVVEEGFGRSYYDEAFKPLSMSAAGFVSDWDNSGDYIAGDLADGDLGAIPTRKPVTAPTIHPTALPHVNDDTSSAGPDTGKAWSTAFSVCGALVGSLGILYGAYKCCGGKKTCYDFCCCCCAGDDKKGNDGIKVSLMQNPVAQGQSQVQPHQLSAKMENGIEYKANTPQELSQLVAMHGAFRTQNPLEAAGQGLDMSPDSRS